jgi:hypothetical protein
MILWTFRKEKTSGRVLYSDDSSNDWSLTTKVRIWSAIDHVRTGLRKSILCPETVLEMTLMPSGRAESPIYPNTARYLPAPRYLISFSRRHRTSYTTSPALSHARHDKDVDEALRLGCRSLYRLSLPLSCLLGLAAESLRSKAFHDIDFGPLLRSRASLAIPPQADCPDPASYLQSLYGDYCLPCLCRFCKSRP